MKQTTLRFNTPEPELSPLELAAISHGYRQLQPAVRCWQHSDRSCPAPEWAMARPCNTSVRKNRVVECEGGAPVDADSEEAHCDSQADGTGGTNMDDIQRWRGQREAAS